MSTSLVRVGMIHHGPEFLSISDLAVRGGSEPARESEVEGTGRAERSSAAVFSRSLRLCHHRVITASASISTSISGDMSALTCSMAVAGLISRKNSPWALQIFY